MAKAITGIIVVLVVIGAFHYFAPDSWKFWGDQTANTIDSVTGNENEEPAHERITAKHQYKNGTHIVAGEVNLPTPCYLLDATTRVSGGVATIDFTPTSSG